MDRAVQLRIEVAAHKAAIRRHRSQLARAKSELVALECARSGIKVVTAEGEKENPWPKEESRSSASTRS